MTSTDDVAGLCAELRDRKERMGPTPGEMIDFMSGILPLIDRSVRLLESQANALREMEASWRVTLALERGVHLNEVRLKDEYRTRALIAESERDTLRARLKEAEKHIRTLVLPVVYEADLEAARAFNQGGK